MADEMLTIERDGQELEVSARQYRLYYKPLGWQQTVVKELTKKEVVEQLKKLDVNFDEKSKVADLRDLLDKELQSKDGE